MSAELTCAVRVLASLGESPMWHPDEQVLYYCDIAGHELRRFDPATATLERWQFDTDVACCAPVFGGGLLLAMRDGIWRFEPATGVRRLLAAPSYDPALERYNDGKCDAAGRFWCGTMYEPRQPPLASLYCLDGGVLTRKAGGATVSNGLGLSPDGRTMYWTDTTAHTHLRIRLRREQRRAVSQDGVRAVRAARARRAAQRLRRPARRRCGRCAR